MNKEKREIVFVYGSLKKGFGNHGFVEDQDYLGYAKSASRDYAMISLGAFPAVCRYPNGTKVAGELYSVDAPTMVALDRLEGNGNLYRRYQEDFINDKGETVKAWIYIMPIQIARAVYSRSGSGGHQIHNDGDAVVWL